MGKRLQACVSSGNCMVVYYFPVAFPQPGGLAPVCTRWFTASRLQRPPHLHGVLASCRVLFPVRSWKLLLLWSLGTSVSPSVAQKDCWLCFGSSSHATAWKLPLATSQGNQRALCICFPFSYESQSCAICFQYLKTVLSYNLSRFLVIFSATAFPTTANCLWAETDIFLPLS